MYQNNSTTNVMIIIEMSLDDLRELAHLPRAVAPEQLQALALGGQARAAAVRRDDQSGQGHRPVVIAVGQQLGVCDARVRLGHVGDVLARGLCQSISSSPGLRRQVTTALAAREYDEFSIGLCSLPDKSAQETHYMAAIVMRDT